MRWMWSLVGVFLFLLFGDAVAQTTYRLQPGDTLAVWVSEQQDLRRQVVIGPDGWLSYPLAGHIKGEGLSLEELEAAISEKLRPYFKSDLNLTVMLQPNPLHQSMIYVVGEVMTPGAYPYRAGMTVLHSLSVAGGRYRAVVSAADQDRVVTVRRTIELAQEQEQILTARMARLQAELKGEPTIPRTDKLRDNPQLAQEQALLTSHLQAFNAQKDARRQTDNAGDRGKEALREQIQAVERRIELAKGRMEATSKLIAKGGAEASRLIERQSEMAELQGRLSQLRSEMATADRANIADDVRFKTLLQERQTQLLVEIQGVRRSLEEARANIINSESILEIYGQSAATSSDGRSQHLAYNIVRAVDGETREYPATETTSLQPGDLVRVFYVAGPEPVPVISQGSLPGGVVGGSKLAEPARNGSSEISQAQ